MLVFLFSCAFLVAHLSIFGYDPRACYRGRGAFESMGSGLAMSPGDIAFKCNFATLDPRTGVVITRRCDPHFPQWGRPLCSYLTGTAGCDEANRWTLCVSCVWTLWPFVFFVILPARRMPCLGLRLPSFPEVEVSVQYATEHRCAVRVRDPRLPLSDCVTDTDPLKDMLPLRRSAPSIPAPSSDGACLAASSPSTCSSSPSSLAGSSLLSSPSSSASPTRRQRSTDAKRTQDDESADAGGDNGDAAAAAEAVNNGTASADGHSNSAAHAQPDRVKRRRTKASLPPAAGRASSSDPVPIGAAASASASATSSSAPLPPPPPAAADPFGLALRTAAIVNELSDEMQRLLQRHPLNAERARAGQHEANVVLLRGCAQRLALQSFAERHNLRGFAIAPTALVAGACACPVFVSTVGWAGVALRCCVCG